MSRHLHRRSNRPHSVYKTAHPRVTARVFQSGFVVRGPNLIVRRYADTIDVLNKYYLFNLRSRPRPFSKYLLAVLPENGIGSENALSVRCTRPSLFYSVVSHLIIIIVLLSC